MYKVVKEIYIWAWIRRCWTKHNYQTASKMFDKSFRICLCHLHFPPPHSPWFQSTDSRTGGRSLAFSQVYNKHAKWLSVWICAGILKHCAITWIFLRSQTCFKITMRKRLKKLALMISLNTKEMLLMLTSFRQAKLQLAICRCYCSINSNLFSADKCLIKQFNPDRFWSS